MVRIGGHRADRALSLPRCSPHSLEQHSPFHHTTITGTRGFKSLSEPFLMTHNTLYTVLQDKLSSHGEATAVMASGEHVECHLGNTDFDVPYDGLFTIDGDTEDGRQLRYYEGDDIESIRLHYTI